MGDKSANFVQIFYNLNINNKQDWVFFDKKSAGEEVFVFFSESRYTHIYAKFSSSAAIVVWGKKSCVYLVLSWNDKDNAWEQLYVKQIKLKKLWSNQNISPKTLEKVSEPVPPLNSSQNQTLRVWIIVNTQNRTYLGSRREQNITTKEPGYKEKMVGLNFYLSCFPCVMRSGPYDYMGLASSKLDSQAKLVSAAFQLRGQCILWEVSNHARQRSLQDSSRQYCTKFISGT